MSINKHIYTFNYETTQDELCKLESRILFDKEEKDKQLASDITIEPSSSAFIRKRLDISLYSEDYTILIGQIEKENITTEGFKVEYIVLEGDTTEYNKRLSKLRDIGFRIQAYPDYKKPTIVYGLCFHEGFWCFGIIIKDHLDWYKHNNKPRSFSHSLNMVVAKALVCIATKGEKEKTLLDACCGVGTIMLEACFSGNQIEGCDINWKAYQNTQENLSHFDYHATVHLSDVGEINNRYDAAIIDLPYNLYSSATDEDIAHIIQSTSKLTNQLVIVSIADITDFITQTGFSIMDTCSITKRGRGNFARKVWICKNNKPV